MIVKDAITSMLKYKKTTQTALAKKIGYETQSGISAMLSRGGLTVKTLIKICDALDYEVTIQPAKKGGRRPEGQFILENTKEDSEI